MRGCTWSGWVAGLKVSGVNVTFVVQSASFNAWFFGKRRGVGNERRAQTSLFYVTRTKRFPTHPDSDNSWCRRRLTCSRTNVDVSRKRLKIPTVGRLSSPMVCRSEASYFLRLSCSVFCLPFFQSFCFCFSFSSPSLCFSSPSLSPSPSRSLLLFCSVP